MRVLVTSTPGTGHVHPIVPLALELRAAGHDVVWATAHESCVAIERFGIRAVPAGLAEGVRTAQFLQLVGDLGRLPPRERRLVAMPTIFGDIAAPAMHDDLVRVFDEVRPDLVVHDLAELAAAPIAVARGIPHVTSGFSGALADALHAAVLASVAPVWEREGVVESLTGFHGELLVHPFPRSMDTPRSDGPSAPMRPLSFDDATAMKPPLWANSFGLERPGVYVTFGTVIAPLAPWTVILHALSDLDVDVVATVGRHVDRSSLGTIPPNARVECYVPQRFLLGRSTLVMSHGGAGTMIGALAGGVPHLCMPIAADQWDNADLLSRHGAGVALEPHERDTSTIRSSVVRLLGDAGVRDAAAALQADVAAMPHPHELVAVLEDLV